MVQIDKINELQKQVLGFWYVWAMIGSRFYWRYGGRIKWFTQLYCRLFGHDEKHGQMPSIMRTQEPEKSIWGPFWI
jgi:hypothetical protein